MDVIEAVEALFTNAAHLVRNDEQAFWLANDALVQVHTCYIETPYLVLGRYLWKNGGRVGIRRVRSPNRR